MHNRLSDSKIAELRQYARDGATYSEIQAWTGCSRMTVRKYTKGTNTHRQGRPPADLSRLRRIVAAVEAGDVRSAALAERFGMKHGSSFWGVVCYARRRLARADREASHV